MPLCGMYTEHTLLPVSDGSYKLDLAWSGGVDVRRLFEGTGFANRVRVNCVASNNPLRPTTTVHLDGVEDGDALRAFCTYLESVVVVHLIPDVEHCFALGLYSSFVRDSRIRSEIGCLVHKAKYLRNDSSSNDLLNRLLEFIGSNPILMRSTAVTAPPKSKEILPNLPMDWAKSVADEMGWPLVGCKKND